MGMDAVPFFLAALMCLLYYLFTLPLTSSFHLRGGTPRRTFVGGGGAATKLPLLQDRADSASAFVLVTCLPAAVYAATHWAVLGEHWIHFWSLLLLGSGPLLFICCLQGKDGWAAAAGGEAAGSQWEPTADVGALRGGCGGGLGCGDSMAAPRWRWLQACACISGSSHSSADSRGAPQPRGLTPAAAAAAGCPVVCRWAVVAGPGGCRGRAAKSAAAGIAGRLPGGAGGQGGVLFFPAVHPPHSGALLGLRRAGPGAGWGWGIPGRPGCLLCPALPCPALCRCRVHGPGRSMPACTSPRPLRACCVCSPGVMWR